jgi:hypothetical protein
MGKTAVSETNPRFGGVRTELYPRWNQELTISVGIRWLYQSSRDQGEGRKRYAYSLHWWSQI